MTSEGHYCLGYIDDFLLFGSKDKCKGAFNRITLLLEELGFDISHHKTITPATEVVCLGILVNTNDFTLSVSSAKLQKIK